MLIPVISCIFCCVSIWSNHQHLFQLICVANDGSTLFRQARKTPSFCELRKRFMLPILPHVVELSPSDLLCVGLLIIMPFMLMLSSQIVDTLLKSSPLITDLISSSFTVPSHRCLTFIVTSQSTSTSESTAAESYSFHLFHDLQLLLQ
jgi:hypothetical protein